MAKERSTAIEVEITKREFGGPQDNIVYLVSVVGRTLGSAERYTTLVELEAFLKGVQACALAGSLERIAIPEIPE